MSPTIAGVVGSTQRQAAPSISLGDTVTFGREQGVASCVLSHPTVSKQHARLSPAAGGAQLEDLGSTNGTFVNGQRLTAPRLLREGDEVRIGPFGFVVRGRTLESLLATRDTELRTRRLSLDVGTKSAPKLLLNDVSVAIKPGEFVAIIGPSGCGKSTLIRQFGGRSSPTAGQVLWNQVDLHRNFDTIKQDIAFVPQREMLPELLTVRSCLTYTAKLRLPADTGAAEIDARVRAAVGRVGLADQVDLPIGRLSGGQRKRASLANELLVSPQVMLLDEVTSGLDETTDYEMMELFSSLAKENGISIICVTHTLANVAAWCDSLLVMARGGIVAYHGPVKQATTHFGVPQLGAIYQKLNTAGGGENWREKHARGSPYYDRVRRDADGPVNVEAAAPATPARESNRTSWKQQLGVLAARYLDIVRADKATLVMAAVQSVVIGVSLRIVFGGVRPPVAREFQLVFLLAVSAFWFGCNNAAKEIVKESALFSLERDVNLRIVSYVLSKLAVQVLLGSLEVTLLFSIVRLTGLTFSQPVAILGVMLLAAAAGTGCGLFISAAAKSEDAAVALVPVALIPQILLSNAMITPLPDFATAIAKGVITAYWAYRAQLQVLDAPGVTGSAAWMVLLAHTAGFTLLAMAALRWRDAWRRQ